MSESGDEEKKEDSEKPKSEKSDSSDGSKQEDKKKDDQDEPKDKEKDKGKDDDKEDKDDSKEDKKPKGPPLYKRPAFIISVSIILVLAIVGGLIFWLYARHFASTSDAYIDGHVMQIAPQVSALVKTLRIDDNVFVHQGDLLVELDPTDYQVALEQAQAQVVAARGKLAQTQAEIESSKASVAEAAAQVDAAQVSLDNATRDLHRYQSVDARARSRQQLDNATTTQKNSEAQLAQAKARKVSAEASVNTSIASAKSAEGDLQTSQASLKRAQVNLGYCRIYAPGDGRVTQRTVEAGNFVTIGETMFMLVAPDIWVTANYKETKLTYMQPGQPVTVTVDAFPKMKLNGRVDSIQMGSGSRFSVLPAENATGNYVKIVQRVPVKILIDIGPNTNNAGMLSPGLSVEAKVRIR